MPLGDVLYESGSQLGHVYFPTTCIVSLLYVMEDGSSAEMAVVGNEGLWSAWRASWVSGHAWRRHASLSSRLACGPKSRQGITPVPRWSNQVQSLQAHVVLDRFHAADSCFKAFPSEITR